MYHYVCIISDLNVCIIISFAILCIITDRLISEPPGTGHGTEPNRTEPFTVIFHTKNCRTRNLWVRIPKSLRQEIRRCTKKIHLLRLRICLTQASNLEILSLKIGRNFGTRRNRTRNRTETNRTEPRSRPGATSWAWISFIFVLLV